ncbi:MAG: hypothetical protein GX556_11400 [Fibrobacter sp.]|nr:hypothetical protein [Fibrobacter sp.]
MTKFRHVVFFFPLIICLSSGEVSSKTAPIIIDPSLLAFDTFPSISSSVKFFVGTIQGTLIEGSTDTIGFTRTGRKTKAPIICSPSSAIKESLQELFSKKGALASEKSSATFVIQVDILDFQLKETSRFLSQTMDAHIKLDVKMVDPYSTENSKRLIVESQNSKSALDTSKHAQEVMRGALESVLLEAIQNLSKS